MIGFNGGLIGADRTPTLAAASGVWTLDEQIKARRSNVWPIVAVGVAATGGTETTSGSYRIHTFNSNGDFVVTVGGDVEYLVAAAVKAQAA